VSRAFFAVGLFNNAVPFGVFVRGQRTITSGPAAIDGRVVRPARSRPAAAFPATPPSWPPVGLGDAGHRVGATTSASRAYGSTRLGSAKRAQSAR